MRSFLPLVSLLLAAGAWPSNNGWAQTRVDDRYLVRSPVAIAEAVRNSRLRFVLRSRSGRTLDLPGSDEQAVDNRGEQSVLTICADCGAEPKPGDIDLIRYTSNNGWLDLHDARLQTLLRATAAGDGEVVVRMRKLSDAVRAHMTGPVRVGPYDDVETALRHRGGDCTEFALVLAAAARAEGIPARLVAGLSYSRRFSGKGHVFSPHMWVQAWTGSRWRSFDAALGAFDSTHLLLAVGDGRPEDYDGVMSQVADLEIIAAGRLPD